MAVPDVAYAGSGDLSIAYHVMGEGPRDLVFTTLLISTVFSAEHEPFASFYRRLASFSRLILFDKRGTRASDRPRTPLTLEAQMEDVRAVLDDVGSEQAALFGSGHGAMMCTLFAATYPELDLLVDPLQRVAASPGNRGCASGDAARSPARLWPPGVHRTERPRAVSLARQRPIVPRRCVDDRPRNCQSRRGGRLPPRDGRRGRE